MALETLKGVKEIDGNRVENDSSKWGVGRHCFIKINHDDGFISFRVQDGPIKEVGVNGCQVDTIIEAAKMIIEGLNKQFPCRENAMVIAKLDEALLWSMKRKIDRERRGVEGESKE